MTPSNRFQEDGTAVMHNRENLNSQNLGNSFAESLRQSGVILDHAPALAAEVVDGHLALDAAYRKACEARAAQCGLCPVLPHCELAATELDAAQRTGVWAGLDRTPAPGRPAKRRTPHDRDAPLPREGLPRPLHR